MPSKRLMAATRLCTLAGWRLLIPSDHVSRESDDSRLHGRWRRSCRPAVEIRSVFAEAKAAQPEKTIRASADAVIGLQDWVHRRERTTRSRPAFFAS